MATTPAAHIERLTEKYRTELATVGPYVVAYLENNGHHWPPNRARLGLTLLEATLCKLIPGYHLHTSATGWTSQGPQLAMLHLSAAARDGYCNATTAAQLERHLQTIKSPRGLLAFTASLWYAADQHSRNQSQEAA
jgi:hypothetical protein